MFILLSDLKWLKQNATIDGLLKPSGEHLLDSRQKTGFLGIFLVFSWSTYWSSFGHWKMNNKKTEKLKINPKVSQGDQSQQHHAK